MSAAAPGAEFPAPMGVEPADRPLRVAIAYSRVPFPMTKGDQLTVSHLIQFLAERGHAVDFFTLATASELTAEQDTWLRERCRRVEVLPHPRWRQLLGVAKAVLTRKPLQVGVFESPVLRRQLDAGIESGAYDVVYTYYARSATATTGHFSPNEVLVRDGNRTAGYLAMQLSQTLNARRIAETDPRRSRRLLFRVEAARMERYEARIWQEYTRVVLIGPKDVEAVQQACDAQGQPRPTNWVYGAHGTDISRFRPARPEDVVPGRIVFSGNMQYEPNVEALLWFVKNCWPTVSATNPDAHLVVVGRDPVRSVRRLESDRITVTGMVPDVGDYIRTASVCVNPMRAAGGMQNKLIEYFACGRPVVLSTVANEGIAAPADVCVIRDDAESFAAEVVRLLSDRADAEAMAARARRHVEDHWTWAAHFRLLEGEFVASLGNSPVG